jgi:hypothetical protein
MRRRAFPLAVGLSAFIAGASLDYQVRKPGMMRDCFCTGVKCALVAIADHPLVALSHPLETLEMLYAARRDF